MKSNLAIGQSGGPTAVINATLAGILIQARACATFTGIVGLAHGLEGALTDEWIDLSGLTDDTLNTLAHTPGAALGSSRRKLYEAEYARVIEVFHARDIHHFAYIGGNGSMWVANHLAEIAAAQGYDLHIVGVPKTIDNDLPCTDHAPGYGSAARFLALATRDAGLDLEAMQTFDDVVILEAMGRDTGWLAAASALLKESDDDAPHLIYVPEIPFAETHFLDDIAQVHARLGRVFVVVAEGIRDVQGQFVEGQQQADKDSLGRTIHGLSAGPGAYLTQLVRDTVGLQTRCFRPGLIGRSSSASVSEVDRAEAYQVGETAARLLADGQGGVMVSIPSLNPSPLHREGLETPPPHCMERVTEGRGGGDKLPYTSTIPLAEVARADIKRLPRAYLNEGGNGVTPAFREYWLPLIGNVPPIVRLDKARKAVL